MLELIRIPLCSFDKTGQLGLGFAKHCFCGYYPRAHRTQHSYQGFIAVASQSQEIRCQLRLQKKVPTSGNFQRERSVGCSNLEDLVFAWKVDVVKDDRENLDESSRLLRIILFKLPRNRFERPQQRIHTKKRAGRRDERAVYNRLVRRFHGVPVLKVGNRDSDTQSDERANRLNPGGTSTDSKIRDKKTRVGAEHSLDLRVQLDQGGRLFATNDLIVPESIRDTDTGATA